MEQGASKLIDGDCNQKQGARWQAHPDSDIDLLTTAADLWLAQQDPLLCWASCGLP